MTQDSSFTSRSPNTAGYTGRYYEPLWSTFMNNNNIGGGGGVSTRTFYWTITFNNHGRQQFYANVDNSGAIYIDGKYEMSMGGFRLPDTGSLVTTTNTYAPGTYTLSATCINTGGPWGIAIDWAGYIPIPVVAGESSKNGTGAQSAYNNQVVTLISSNTSTTPRVEVSYKSSTEGSGGTIVTTKTKISGSKTPTLRLESDRVGIQTVRAVVNHPKKCFDQDQVNGLEPIRSGGLITAQGTSKLSSNTVNFESISAVNRSRSFINHELVAELDVDYNFISKNLFLGPLPLQAPISESELAADVVYSPEEDLTVQITLAASAGQSFSGNRGGQGGVSKFTYTLKKNTEYVFKLGSTVEPASSIGRGGAAAYFYEKGRLLVACGGGGASGWNGGNGGNGGGPGVSGSSGSGPGAGSGGVVVSDGQLTSVGELPSGGNGGKIESCTTGEHWSIFGYSPCQDIGLKRWWDFDGEEYEESNYIERGYKSSGTFTYGFRNNGGNSSLSNKGTFFGGGGSGATGGNSTTNFKGGGGGGSGYTSGDVTIIESKSGGNGTNRSWATIELVSL